ncbi:MAG: glycosyltransferase family 1 protein [Bryobacterales bacterium]|nr:glycosyltransferase family 1 protein [Bryobacterales bacterium]
MRIVFDARHVRDFGIGTYIRNLLRALLEVESENTYVLIGYRESRGDLRALAKLSNRVSVTYFEGRDDSWRDHLAFPWFLRQHRGDVYHVPLARVPLFMPKPYVVTVHDIGFLLFADKKDWRMEWRERLIGHGLRRASKVIAVSGATQRDVQQFFNIPAERLQKIYDAPDPELFPGRLEDEPSQPNRLTHRQQLLERFQIDSPFLLYAGTVRPQKNVPRLIEAFSVLRSELVKHPHYRRLKLLIIGDEISKNPSVRLAVLHSRLEDSVRFLGFVPDDTLRVFFEAAEAFVFPSLYEGFGLAPLEAMMAGTPVVASNVSALPEVLGDAAKLVNPDNVFEIARGIHDVLLDSELRASLIEKGAAQARKYSWTDSAKQVVEIYREAVNRRA